MVTSLPFSITPDAEDFLRSRINEIPPEAKPFFVMGESQAGDNWSYKGRSFVIGYFEPGDEPKKEWIESELFGRRISIASDALKELSGHTLGLRKVDSRYGLVKNTIFVLVSDPAPEPPSHIFGEGDFVERMKRGFSIGALSILGGFTGMGVAWIITAVVAPVLKIPTDTFIKYIGYVFAAGWILGAIVSFFFFRNVYKADGMSQFKQEQRQRRYLGSRRPQNDMNWWIFLGLPVSVVAILMLLLESFVHALSDTQKCYAALITGMVVLGASMYFSERMPRRLILGLGISGWVLALTLGCLFFKIHGP